MDEHIDMAEGTANYTIIVDTISDMSGYTVEIVDKYNNQDYVLQTIYKDRKLALQEADDFINKLFEHEITMLIN